MTRREIRMRLTVLNPGKRLTAEAVSSGNGRNCFMPSDVWTAGRVGRTRAGMRPFWHVLPVGGREKATYWTAEYNRDGRLSQSIAVYIHVNLQCMCVFSLHPLYHHVPLHCETSYLWKSFIWFFSNSSTKAAKADIPYFSCSVSSASWFDLNWCQE